ncbi:MAG: hypothetical protein CMO68_00315 [Verrucomicrobiales bacterium]|nr:hypothetical protein [Verrucomicrobiales bacterium]
MLISFLASLFFVGFGYFLLLGRQCAVSTHIWDTTLRRTGFLLGLRIDNSVATPPMWWMGPLREIHLAYYLCQAVFEFDLGLRAQVIH